MFIYLRPATSAINIAIGEVYFKQHIDYADAGFRMPDTGLKQKNKIYVCRCFCRYPASGISIENTVLPRGDTLYRIDV